MMLYKFADLNQVTVLLLSGQFMKACDSDGESEGIAMWILPFVLATSPVALLTIRMTPR